MEVEIPPAENYWSEIRDHFGLDPPIPIKIKECNNLFWKVTLPPGWTNPPTMIFADNVPISNIVDHEGKVVGRSYFDNCRCITVFDSKRLQDLGILKKSK